MGPCLVKIWNSLSRLFTAQNYKLSNPHAVFKSILSFLLYMFSLTPLPDRFSLINSSIGSSSVANLSEYSLIEFNHDFLFVSSNMLRTYPQCVLCVCQWFILYPLKTQCLPVWLVSMIITSFICTPLSYDHASRTVGNKLFGRESDCCSWPASRPANRLLLLLQPARPLPLECAEGGKIEILVFFLFLL